MSSESPSTSPRGEFVVRRVPAWVYVLGVIGVLIGAVTFGLAARAPDPAPAWRALLINFLFWTSAAQGMFVWAVTFRLSRTVWSAPFARLGHSTVGFLGISVLIFVGLFFGRQYYLPWLHMDLGDRHVWLNVPFVFLRDGICLLALFLLGVAYVRVHLRDDLMPDTGDEARRTALRRHDHRLSVLGVILALVYTVTATLIGLDLVMSLAPGWFSALLGWYYLIGGLYVGMASIIITTVLLRRWLGVSVRTQQFQDLGNLQLAFAMAMTYFFFSQALVIWYENLPLETIFAIPRLHLQPWGVLSWLIIWTCYLGPFFLMLIREVKENPRTLVGVSLLVFFAMWFERYMLIMPSLAPRATHLPILVPLIGAGFLGLLILTMAPLLARSPMFGLLDIRAAEERQAWA